MKKEINKKKVPKNDKDPIDWCLIFFSLAIGSFIDCCRHCDDDDNDGDDDCHDFLFPKLTRNENLYAI